jgi:hypothetical protein
MKPTISSTTTAYATVKVRVRCGTYGPGCTMDQILQQASREARQHIVGALHKDTRVQVLACDVVDMQTSVERK